MASTAVGLELASRIVGYGLTPADFSESSPNLPMRIAVLAEANHANQSGLDTAAKQITTAEQAANLYGWGSPIHLIMRVLRPLSGSGVGGIPTVVYPQAAAVGAAAKVMTITPTGNATANGTHTVKIGGRRGLDGQIYDINIVIGDTPTLICDKIEDAILAVLGAPVLPVSDTGVLTATAKWKGLTSQDLTIEVDTNGNSLGVTYAVAQTVAGSGTPSVAAALALFGNTWNTLVINSYGFVTATIDTLEAFNGEPSPTNPTGRYSPTIFKPFVALSGSVLDDPTALTDASARKTQLTLALCPAPNSKGFGFEAAANMAVLCARVAQDTPHLDVAPNTYPDMPTPISIGSMAVYANRESFLKKGCSTVDLVDGRYAVQDFVTTYHKTGELIPQFNYVRNLILDWNVRFGYFLLEQEHVMDHALANDNDNVSATKVVKPKKWRSHLTAYANNLISRALIVDLEFFLNNLLINISSSNPNRLETAMKYKRSGTVRIASTTAEAGFNLGQ